MCREISGLVIAAWDRARVPAGMKRGLKLMPFTAGCSRPKRTILPISCSFTPRSMAGTRITVQPICASRSSASSFFGQNVGLASNDAIRLAFKTVELEIDVRLYIPELFEEPVVRCDSFAIRVQHHVADAAILRGLHHRNDLRMNGRLAARKLHYFRIAFGRDQMIENLFDFFQREVEARARFRETERTVHVARAVHLDDAQTCVLLMVRAESTIERAAAISYRRKLKRYGARFVEFRGIGIHACVAVHERFERPVLRAALPHIDLVVADQDLCVDDGSADGTYAPGKLVENIIGVFFECRRAEGRTVGTLHR